MDNLTHSLLGAALGLKIAGRNAKPSDSRAIVFASLLANNLPDADILYASSLSKPFGYLLHHRGHTHTFVGAIAVALLGWWIVCVCWKYFGSPLSRAVKRKALFATLLGGFVHILCDGLNSYGIHPWWPFSNRWVFGDTLFIIEPTLWFALALGLAPMVGLPMRIVNYLIAAGAAALIGLSGKVPPEVVWGLGGTAVVGIAATRFVTRRRQAQVWFGLAIGILASFVVTRSIAQTDLSEALSPEQPSLIAFVQPSPANPFCWSAWEMRRSGEDVLYTRLSLNLLQPLVELDCKRYGLLPQSQSSVVITEKVTQIQRHVLASSAIDQLADNCRWKAFLQFARLPGVIECRPELGGASGGPCSVDYRFSRPSANNFTVKPLSGECPAHLPPWDPPLQELLDPGLDGD